MGIKNDVPQEKWLEIYHELLSMSKENTLSEEATQIIHTYLEGQLLSDTEIATILLTFQEGLSSDENNPTDDKDDKDDTDDMDIVEEGIVLASV